MLPPEANVVSPQDSQRYFDDAIHALQALLLDSTLGEPSPDPEVVADNPGLKLLQELRQKKNETAALPEWPVVLPLTPKKFAEYGLNLPLGLKDLMQTNDFYLVRIPVTVMPRPGFLFWRLMCVIELNPGGPAPRPTAVRVFPTEAWQSIVEAHQGAQLGLDEGLQIGLDDNLQFKLVAGPTANPGVPAAAKAKVGAQFLAGAGATLGPFHYHIQRPVILARGQGSSTVRWTLDGKDPLKQEDLELGLVLQVPKTIAVVNVSGALLAYREFDSMMAQMKDIWDRVRDQFLSREASAYFDQGAPLPDHKNWPNITKGLPA